MLDLSSRLHLSLCRRHRRGRRGRRPVSRRRRLLHQRADLALEAAGRAAAAAAALLPPIGAVNAAAAAAVGAAPAPHALAAASQAVAQPLYQPRRQRPVVLVGQLAGLDGALEPPDGLEPPEGGEVVERGGLLQRDVPGYRVVDGPEKRKRKNVQL